MRGRSGVGGVAALFILLVIASLLSVPAPVRGAPGVDSIVIVDAPGGAGSWVSSRDYKFGNTDVFWAAAYNTTSGFVEDVSAYWYSYGNPTGRGGGVVWLNRTYGPSVQVHAAGFGTAEVYAYYYPGVNQTYRSNATGPLRVSVDNVDSVIVRTERGGMGTWVGATTYGVGDDDFFYPAAYNTSLGFLGDIFSNWTSSNTTVGYVYPTSPGGTQCYNGTADVCYPLGRFHASAVGFTYVTAEPIGTSLSNTTGKLTVTTVGIDYVQIRDAPNGHGAVLGSRTYYPREQDTFYAASYNTVFGYRGDVTGTWTSNNTAVCEPKGYFGGTAHGSSVQVLLKVAGACSVTVVAATPSGPVSNVTGTLTVLPRTVVTVDDSGGKDFLKIQDAVDFAQAGYTVFIFTGTYPENVVVRKELEIVGESRTAVLIDGRGLDGVTIAADRVVLHEITILNAHTGVLQIRTNNTRVYDTTIKNYDVGLFNEHTLNAWVAYNLITRGRIGVVTNVSYDDAIRWNEISFNSRYGAKSFDTRLRNCFNWNNLHDNAIGYFHDPTSEYPPMEFDGNVLTGNGVGVKVENASSVTLTNNTFTGGSTGVQLLNSSSTVRSNTFAGVGVAVVCRTSGSNITNNVIDATSAGIACNGGAPRIEGNDVRVASGEALLLSNLDRAIVRGNDLHGGTLRVVGSHLVELAAVHSAVILQNSPVDRLTLDAASRLEIRWTVRVRAVEPGGAALAGATVIVHDSLGSLVFVGATGANGFTTPALLTTEVRGGGSVETRNPFTFEVSTQGGRAAVTMVITSQTDVVVAVPVPNPWPMIVLVAAAMTLTASLGAAFATERSRFALLGLLTPLYTRLSKDKVLESYNRGRVYQYVALNPGAHFNGILAALDMNNGLLVYHLEVLHREGLLRSRSEGMYRRFYTTDTQPPPILENGTTEAQLRVLKAIQEMPGITQKELSRFLGLRQSTLAYQIDRLTAMGYVAAEKQGRKVHYLAKKGGN